MDETEGVFGRIKDEVEGLLHHHVGATVEAEGQAAETTDHASQAVEGDTETVEGPADEAAEGTGEGAADEAAK